MKKKTALLLTHVWYLPRLPISLSDEAGEAALRMDKTMARVASTQPDAAAADIAANELYRLINPVQRKSKQVAF